MSAVYTLRTEILSVQVAISAARQLQHSSVQTISAIGWLALVPPRVRQRANADASLIPAFLLYKRYWESYLDHCRNCIDTMSTAITWKENKAEVMGRLERGLIEKNERARQMRLIEKAKEMFALELAVLKWEMETLRFCFARIGVEWEKIVDMAR